MSYNPLSALRGLFPQPRLQVGVVMQIVDGTATLELYDGSTIRARGSAAVGDTVYIRNNLIEGPAPALAVIEIEI